MKSSQQVEDPESMEIPEAGGNRGRSENWTGRLLRVGIVNSKTVAPGNSQPLGLQALESTLVARLYTTQIPSNYVSVSQMRVVRLASLEFEAFPAHFIGLSQRSRVGKSGSQPAVRAAWTGAVRVCPVSLPHGGSALPSPTDRGLAAKRKRARTSRKLKGACR